MSKVDKHATSLHSVCDSISGLETEWYSWRPPGSRQWLPHLVVCGVGAAGLVGLEQLRIHGMHLQALLCGWIVVESRVEAELPPSDDAASWGGTDLIVVERGADLHGAMVEMSNRHRIALGASTDFSATQVQRQRVDSETAVSVVRDAAHEEGDECWITVEGGAGAGANAKVELVSVGARIDYIAQRAKARSVIVDLSRFEYEWGDDLAVWPSSTSGERLDTRFIVANDSHRKRLGLGRKVSYQSESELRLAK